MCPINKKSHNWRRIMLTQYLVPHNATKELSDVLFLYEMKPNPSAIRSANLNRTHNHFLHKFWNYTKYCVLWHQFYISCSRHIVIAPIASPTLHVDPTQFVIVWKSTLSIIDLQCCNFCHSFSGFFLSNFWSYMTIFHHINLKMQNTVGS